MKQLSTETSVLVTVCRFIFAATLFWAWLNHSHLDELVDAQWMHLRGTWWFRHDSFEPVCATVSFGVWLQFWSILGKVQALDQFIMMKSTRKVDHHTGVPYRAAAVYLGILLTIDYYFPRRKLPLNGPGRFWNVVADIVLGIVCYDLLFFPIHVAMHYVPQLKKFHLTHHQNTTGLFSTEVLRHSLVDGSLQVAANVIVLNTLRLHPYTRMWYNIVITYLLCEIHAGYDLPWGMHNIIPKFYGGAPRHESHHIDGARYFQQFFTYLDDYVFPLLQKTKI